MSHWTHAWYGEIGKHDALVASEDFVRSTSESLPADLRCLCRRGGEFCLRPPGLALADGTLWGQSELDEASSQLLRGALSAADVRRLLVVSGGGSDAAERLRQRLDPTEIEIVEIYVGAGNADSYLSADEEQLVAERLRALGYI
jgi:hypothetical protein